MANQAEPGTFGEAAPERGGVTSAPPAQRAPFVGQAPGSPVAPQTPYHGRTVSWVAVSTIVAGFLIGGVAIALDHHGPQWWLFWTGAALAGVGGLLALATGIFEDWY
jgi:hypothetical protein